MFENVVRALEEQCILLDAINKGHMIPEELDLAQAVVEPGEILPLELSAITKEMSFDGEL